METLVCVGGPYAYARIPERDLTDYENLAGGTFYLPLHDQEAAVYRREHDQLVYLRTISNG